MRLFLLDGPWYTAVVRARSAQEALEVSASLLDQPEAPGAGWADMGHERSDIDVEEIPLEGPAALVHEHSG